jgi:hypothetical protein
VVLGSSHRDIVFELEQTGPTVRGLVRISTGVGTPPGLIDGTVAGDVFRFRDSRGSFGGELTVSGDEMNGTVSFATQPPLSLRRVDRSSSPVSPPR